MRKRFEGILGIRKRSENGGSEHGKGGETLIWLFICYRKSFLIYRIIFTRKSHQAKR